MTTTIADPTLNFPTIGMSTQALVGADLDVYFYNSTWTTPIKKYLEADHILPTKIRLDELPGNALVVKSLSGWYRNSQATHNNRYVFPLSYQLFFTGGQCDPGYSYVPRIMQYLSFETKENWDKYTRAYYSGYIKVPEPIFKDTDSLDTVTPRLSFSNCPRFSVEDLQSMQLGLQYLLKLFKIVFNLQYDETTNKWIE